MVVGDQQVCIHIKLTMK